MSLHASLLRIGTFLLLFISVTAFICPDHCSCKTINRDNHIYNHAKCYSLIGLRNVSSSLGLHSLDLSNAKLKRIKNNLEKFRSLTDLDLSNNHLTEIGRLGKRIKSLNLSHNRITSGKLTRIPLYVEQLNLSYNSLTYLPQDFTKLTKLRSLELDGNPINCTCYTLDVRNWLQVNHVWTDKHIKCSYPASVKRQPWLQVKQPEICLNEGINYKIFEKLNSSDENDIMLGDQPVLHDDPIDKENSEELGKDFLVVKDQVNKKSIENIKSEDIEEGSGGIFEDNIKLSNTETTSLPLATEKAKTTLKETINASYEYDEDEDDEEESSGGGLALFSEQSTPISTKEIIDHTSQRSSPNNDSKEENDGIWDNLTLPTFPSYNDTDIFGPGLGIMQFNDPSTEEPKKLPEEVNEIPFKDKNIEENQKQNIHVDTSNEGGDNPSDIHKEHTIIPEREASNELNNNELKEASPLENQNTYILLGIILVFLVCLMFYVAIKHNKKKRRNRHQNDLENPKSTELVDMNKKNLGKPIIKNGTTELVPLIKERELQKITNGDRKIPYMPAECDENVIQPLLNENGKIGENNQKPIDKIIPEKPKRESNNNNNNNNKELENQLPKQLIENNIINDEISSYPPIKPKSPTIMTNNNDNISPKPSRYSPVYIPETGRVKIKLTETQRPKTPILVTRSRSNAGDIITTIPNNTKKNKDDQ